MLHEQIKINQSINPYVTINQRHKHVSTLIAHHWKEG